MTIVQWLAVWFIASVLAAPLIGSILHRRRIRNELRYLLNTSDADWAVKHREFMARRRSGVEVKLAREALIETITDDQREIEKEQAEFNQKRIPRDNAYLERARRAESFGFVDPDDAA